VGMGQAVTLPALAPWALMNTSALAPSHKVQAWQVVFWPRSILAAQCAIPLGAVAPLGATRKHFQPAFDAAR